MLVDSAKVDVAGSTEDVFTLAGESDQGATAVRGAFASFHEFFALESVDEPGSSAPAEANLIGDLGWAHHSRFRLGQHQQDAVPVD